MRDIKKKKFIKLKLTKQIIFTEDVLKSHYQKKPDIFLNQLKQRDAILTSVKEIDILEIDILNENCFVYYKLNHIFKECSHRVIKVNVINDNANEFNRFIFDSNFNIKN